MSKVIKGVNDLATVRPDLLNEWDYDKNSKEGLSPEMFSRGSHKKVWWKCSKCGNSYEKVIYDKTKGIGCPYCSGRYSTVGKNDLATTVPELLLEWNYEKNNELGITPESVTSHSGRKVWWTCKNCGHVWKAVIQSRTRGIGCPVCASVRHTSVAEQFVYYYTKQVFPDVINSYKPDFLRGKEFDLFIPPLKLAIEYDGEAWHKNVIKDNKKTELAKENSVNVIRIREPNCPELVPSDNLIIIKTQKPKDDYVYLESAIKQLFGVFRSYYNVNDFPKIDVTKDYALVVSNYETAIKTKSLSVTNPSLAAEWNYDKNKGLTPENVTEFSGKKVWWKCEYGHEWQAKVNDRNRQHGCPYCSGHKIMRGFNDLETLYPKLISDNWNYGKNGTVLPSDFGKGSNTTVWWKCEKGHEWQQSISSFLKNQNCPYCIGSKVFPGYNDITVTNPEEIKEWDYERNNQFGFIPQNFSFGSHQKVWWKCSKCGNSYEKTIKDRCRGGGCPYCTNQKVLSGYNDLETKFPEIAKEWDYDKNIPLIPNNVTYGSNKKVWWKCSDCGYEWETRIIYRTNKNTGCPNCRKKKII